MPRKPLGDRAMTDVERQARHRARAGARRLRMEEQRRRMVDALTDIRDGDYEEKAKERAAEGLSTEGLYVPKEAEGERG